MSIGGFVDWWDAAEVLCERMLNASNGIASLSEDWQRDLLALMLVNRDVNNGGYLQFLANHGREAYVYASRSLTRIGAHRMADIIDQCQALVDEHVVTEGKETAELWNLMPNRVILPDGSIREPEPVLPRWVIDRTYDLSSEFMAYPENVEQLADAYFARFIPQGIGDS